MLTILFSLIIVGCQNNLATDNPNTEDENQIINNEKSDIQELSPDNSRSAYISSENEDGLNSLYIYNIAMDETKIYPEDFGTPIIPNMVKWLDNEYLLVSAEYGTIEKKKRLYLFDTIIETYYIVENVGSYKEVADIQINGDIITIDYAKLDLENNQYGTEQETLTYTDILYMARVESYEKVMDISEQTALFYGGRKSIYIQANDEIKPLGRGYSSYPEVSPDKSRIVFIDPDEWETLRALSIYDITKDSLAIILESNENGSNTPKVVKWLDDRYLLVIMGYAYGTVSLGGQLYIYDTETEQLSLALQPEANTEFRDISNHEGIITLDVARWTDSSLNEYVMEKKEISYRELLDGLGIQTNE